MSDILGTITRTIERAPHWLRRDLLSEDHVARSAAEEALATMIAKALAGHQE
jgi:hypothetical protein